MMNNLRELLEHQVLTLQWDVTTDHTHEGLLSTAALTQFMLGTGWRLVDPVLDGKTTSVTALVQVSHEEPTPAEETVTVEARVTEVTGNIVRIAFTASDETGVIAHGFNERHVVDRVHLNELAERRAAALKSIT